MGKSPQQSELFGRITVGSQQCNGRPCVRNTGVCVSEVLLLLSRGETNSAVADRLAIDIDDVRACLEYAVYCLTSN